MTGVLAFYAAASLYAIVVIVVMVASARLRLPLLGMLPPEQPNIEDYRLPRKPRRSGP